MAEAVITSIAEEIVAFLGSQAIETVGKIRGVKREFKLLKDTVSALRPVLEHAEEQYHQNPQIKGWVANLKDALYDVQDVYEEFDIEAKRQELRGHNEIMKKVRTFFSSSNQLAFKLKMSDKVRSVRERIEVIIKAGEVFHLEKRPVEVERQWGKREETHSYIREEDIKGRDDDKKAVKDFLLDPNVQENVTVLPIVGIGGLGKTALAQYVYNDEMVSKHFQLKMWVCVSDNFDKKKIVKNMIACAKKKEPTENVMEQLQRELRGEIDGKRYLLVLDDWWNEEREIWLSLRSLLLGGARGSKILVTTCLRSVAETTIFASPYLLKGLSESASLELLMQIACCKKEELQDLEMLAIGNDIVRKCYGVPLAIRTLGGLLLGKSKRQWSQFREKELPHVSQREDGIASILKLSYDHLPSHLKQCFAFCSLFPKDYVINTQTLINLWMAEGFIQPSYENQHLEDIAHGYFMDLLYSNFFQDYQEDEETCKMHDLMHDLACLVAGIECRRIGDDTKSIDERTRHISTGNLSISQLKASPLRTFLSIMQQERIEVDLEHLMKSFKRLHILGLEAILDEKVPESIGKLKHLKYLDFSGNHFLKRLPNSITKLQNLQTLNLRDCYSLEELPRDIRKLVSLRNLDIDNCLELSYMPQGLGQLTTLHRLTRFVLPTKNALSKNYCRLRELNGLNNIRGSLCIENLESMTDAVEGSKAANLMGKHSLEYLALKWRRIDPNDVKNGDRDEALLDELMPHSNLKRLEVDRYKGESFPRWMRDSLVSSLPNLVFLSLSNCTRCRSLPQLGQLPHLESLGIFNMSELEYIDSDHSSTLTESFPSLSSLEIEWCRNLKAMPRAPHLTDLALRRWANPVLINLIFGFNKLKRLEIIRMEFPECLSDECWKSLTSLEYLFIWDCRRLTSLGVRYLSSLVDLTIWECEELDLCKGESGNIILDSHGLPSLRSVYFYKLPKLGASLPQWLLQASNLERLSIDTCVNLNELPEQIEALQSLQRLDIIDCPSLTSLPEAMRGLASLTRLNIADCPKLEERCRRDEGEDWCKISHIPDISHNRYPTW